MLVCKQPKRKSLQVIQNQNLLRLRLSYQEKIYYSDLFMLCQDSTTGNVNLENFPKLLGIFGTDIAEDIANRIFEIFSGNKNYITLPEYLKYIDVYHYGDEGERCNVTCKLMDFDNNGKITLSNFKDYINLIIGAVRRVNPSLKSELFSEEDISVLFNKISNNKEYFTYDEFSMIYKEKPELLSWIDYFKNDSNDILLIIHKNIKKIIKYVFNFTKQINNLIKKYRKENLNKDDSGDKIKDFFELLEQIENTVNNLKDAAKLQNKQFINFAKNNQISLRNLFSIINEHVEKEEGDYVSENSNNEEENKEQEKSVSIFSEKKGEINPLNFFKNDKLKKNKDFNDNKENNINQIKRLNTIKSIFDGIKKNLKQDFGLNIKSCKNIDYRRKSFQVNNLITNKLILENEEIHINNNIAANSEENINNENENETSDLSNLSDLFISEEDEEDVSAFKKNINILQNTICLKMKSNLDNQSRNKFTQNTSEKQTLKISDDTEENKQIYEVSTKTKTSKEFNGLLKFPKPPKNGSLFSTCEKDEKYIKFIDKLLNCIQLTSKIFMKSIINLSESYKWIEMKYLQKTIINIKKTKRKENRQNLLNKVKNFYKNKNQNNEIQPIVVKNIPNNRLKATGESFKILLNTIMGIQIAVESSPDISEIKDIKQFLNSMTYSIQTANLSKNKQEIFRIKEYAGIVFNSIRKLYGYDKESFIQSISPQVFITEMIISNTTSIEELFNTGSSGSLFYYTKDGKLILKTISKSEYVTLKRILPKYYDHLVKYKNTYLPKFFGCYKLIKKVKKKKKYVYFIIMMNVFSTNKQIHVRFDLKGSTLNREVLSKEEKYTQNYKDILGKYSYSLKDIDFDYFKKHIYIDNHIYGQLIEQLNQDSLLLKECNINDYSLLLGIHKNKLHSNASSILDNINDDELNSNLNKSQLSFNDIDKGDISIRGRNISTNRKLKEDSLTELSSITSINNYSSDKKSSQDKLSKEEYYKQNNPQHKIVLDDNGIYNEKYKEIYYIGIIDILTNYDGLKMCEFCYKSVRYCTNKMSCIAPGKYQERFIKYLRQKILPCGQDSEEEGLVKISKTNTFDGGKNVFLEKKLNISTNEDNPTSKNKSEMILNKHEIFDTIN